MLKYIVVPLLFILSLVNGADIDSSNLDEKALLESLFGKQITSDVKDFPVPISINGHSFSTTRIDIKNDKVFIDKNDLEMIFNLTTIGNWNSGLKEDIKIPIEYFFKHGIKATYDDQKLKLLIDIPPKLFKVNTIMFNIIKENTQHKDALEIAKYSGVSNFHIQQNFADTANDNLIREELNIRNSFFFNLEENILNGSLTYQENRKKRLRRGAFFVEKDQPVDALRYKAGEIYLPTSLRLNPQNVFGFSASTILKLFKLNHKNTIRINQYEFFLERDSNVKIYINDIYKKSINLRAGTHNIYDLNIPQGLSKVKLVIEDRYGEIDILEFDDYNYNDILSQGTLLYGYGVGIKRYEDDDSIKFYEEDKILSFNLKYGLTNNLTIETGANISDKISFAYDIYYGTKFGKINPFFSDNRVDFNGVETRKKQTGLGFNTRVFDTGINLYRKKVKEYTDGEYTDTTDTSFIGLSRRLTSDTNINTNYTVEKTDTDKEKTINIGFDYEINENLTLDIDYNNKTTQSGDNQNSIEFLFTYRLDDTTYSYDRSFNEYDDESENEIKTTYTFAHRIKGETDYSISAYKKDSTLYPSSEEISVRADDIKYKLYTKYLRDSNNRDNINISLQTAIAFAGTKATLTKPINGSFILLSNNSAIEDNIVGIKNHAIRKDIVVSNSDYNIKKILLDESKLLKNYSLPKSTMYVQSKYKSGSLLNIELPVSYLVKGTLHNEKSEPISFGAFEIVNLKTKESYLTFTNGEGVFYLENIKPANFTGHYINPEKADKNKSFQFTISDEVRKSVEIDIGVLKVK